MLRYYHSNDTAKTKEAKDEEEPNEPLGVVTKVIVLIFLVTFTYFIPFISKHGITLRICTCTCVVIHWRSLANSSCIFFESASLTCTDVFNWVGAFSRTLSIFILLFLFAILSNIAQMLNKGRATISEHISNIFKEGELEEKVVCRKFRQTTQHGALEGKTQSKDVKYYNLDVIISVGYRVKKRFKGSCSVSSSHSIRLLRSLHSTPSATAFVSSGHCIRLLQLSHSSPSAIAFVSFSHCIRLLQLMQPSHSANSAVSFC